MRSTSMCAGLFGLMLALCALGPASAQEGGLGAANAGAGTPQGTIGTGGFGHHTGTSSISRVRLGATTVSGRGLSRARIRRVLSAALGSARRCYEAELARRPDLAGTLSVSFVVSAGGRAMQPIGGELLGNRYVGACVAQTIRNLDFGGPSAGEVAVTQVYVFTTPRR